MTERELYEVDPRTVGPGYTQSEFLKVRCALGRSRDGSTWYMSAGFMSSDLFHES